MAYVHTACLSQSRSQVAAQRCSICQHQYITRLAFLHKFLRDNCDCLMFWLSIVSFVMLCLLVHQVCIGVPFLHNAVDREAERIVLTTEKVCSTIVSAVPQQLLMGMTDEVVCEPFKRCAQWAPHCIAIVMLTSILATIVGELWAIIRERAWVRWPTNMDLNEGAMHSLRIANTFGIVAHYFCSTDILYRYSLYIAACSNVQLCFVWMVRFVETWLLYLVHSIEEFIVEPEVLDTDRKVPDVGAEGTQFSDH